MLRTLSALVALVACANAVTLPLAEHQVVPADAIGTFRRATVVGVPCARMITHTATVNDDGVIPHSAMTMNGNACDDGGAMSVFTDANEAKNALQDQGLKDIVDDLVNTGTDVIFGVEVEGRNCTGSGGSRSFLRSGTLVALFKPEDLISVGVFPLPGGMLYMIVDDPEDDGSCLYTADPATNPTPTMDPSASETPGPSPDPGSPQPPPGTGGDPSPTATAAPPSQDPGSGGVGGDDDGTGDGDSTDVPTTEPGEPTPGPAGDGPPTPTPEDDPICFPADATVEMEDGSIKKMSQIELGDRVKVADGEYSDVFMFTHKDASTVHNFIKISTEARASLVVTAGHYIYINGALAAASTVKVGDAVELANGDRTTVNVVDIVKSVGLYNPQTVHGDIIVNSIRSSTFTRVIEPATAQALLAPIRMLYDTVGWSFSFLDNGADGVAQLLSRGRATL